MAEFIAYDSRDAADATLARGIARDLAAAIAERGQAWLVVSGGSSPVGLFHALQAQRLDWARVNILPSDERWVPAADAQSNEGMMQRELLQGPVAQARFIGLYRDAERPANAIATLETELAELPDRLDVVVLGMGSDGHTASLFPDAASIEADLACRAACVAPALAATPARISLTLHRLCAARRLDVLFFGEEKRQVYARAAAAGPVAEYPVRGVLRCEQPTARVHWAP